MKHNKLQKTLVAILKALTLKVLFFLEILYGKAKRKHKSGIVDREFRATKHKNQPEEVCFPSLPLPNSSGNSTLGVRVPQN